MAELDTADVVEDWLRFQGLTMAQLKRDDRRPHLMLIRHRISKYLRRQGWSLRAIGHFLDRDQRSVQNYLKNGEHV